MFLSGIDIGGTSIKFGIFDEQLNLLQQWSRPTPKEPAEAAALIAAQLEPYHVAAIGAGAPGTLNAARETITADNLAWVDVPLAALLRRASGLPAVVINDGHAAMLAEMRSGALQNVRTGMAKVSEKTIEAAQIFLAALPIMCVYPFLQKYYTKGIVVGSVKG